MKKLRYFICILIITLASSNIMANPISVSATIDSTTLLIGEQRTIHIEVEHPKIVEMQFPDFSKDKMLTEGIEIVRMTDKDTTNLKGGSIRIEQDLIITSFDAGRYEIEPFKFSTPDQYYTTNRFIINVVTIEEDFTKAQLNKSEGFLIPSIDILRAIQLLSLLLIVAGIVGFIVLYKIIVSKKSDLNFEFDIRDRRTPQEVAMSSLNNIKDEKIWQQGQQKKYYTQITETLRLYFMERFNISALEMTSDQIIEELRKDDDAARVDDKIDQVFKLSDMVKFAKYQPTQEENEMSIVNAMLIVNQTAQNSNDVSNNSQQNPEESAENKEFTL